MAILETQADKEFVVNHLKRSRYQAQLIKALRWMEIKMHSCYGCGGWPIVIMRNGEIQIVGMIYKLRRYTPKGRNVWFLHSFENNNIKRICI